MKKPIQLSDHFAFGRLLRFALPSVYMMIFTSIYGVVDGFFVSNFAGKTPFAAVNLIFPLLMILSTVGFMFGTGGSAIVAHTLGEKRRALANRYFSLFVYVTLGLGVLFAILGITFLRPIAYLLGGRGELLNCAVRYGQIILLALPFNVLQLLFQTFFVTAEKPKLGLYVTLLSGVTNMVLDAVLVILLPQQWKLLGAAIATAMSQVVGGVLPLVYFLCRNNSLLQLGKTRFQGSIIWRATLNGSSEFMSNISMNIVGMLYNLQLLAFAGEDGVAAYGVMMYASFIFAAAFMGYSFGTAPLFGFNQGAQNIPELKNLLQKSMIIVGISGAAMVAIGITLARPLSSIFVGYEPGLLDLTVSGFQIFALSFFFMGYAIFISGFFTALGDGLTSALVSFLRTLVFQVAAVLLLPLVFGISGIWWSVVVAEATAMAFSILFLVLKRKRYLS